MAGTKPTALATLVFALTLVLPGCGEPARPPVDREPETNESQEPAGPIEVAPHEAPPDMKTVLEEARRFALSPNPFALGAALARVHSGFAEVVPEVEETDVPRWTKVRLNTHGARFDAIRFSNPLGFSADLVWVFALPADTLESWYIVPRGGPAEYSFGFKDFHGKGNLEIPELDLPKRNEVYFQQLEGKQIAISREYFLWFNFQVEDPVDVYVKLKLVNAGRETCPHFTTAHPAAEQLGIELPFRFTDAASLTDRATDVGEHRGLEAGMEFLEEELPEAGDREAEFYYARLAYGRALQLAKKEEDRDKANRFFVKAAEWMRALREKYGELEFEEGQILALALYGEACSLAITGRPEEGLESLREAVQAGYDDFPQIRGSPELQSVRDLSAFDEWFKELDDAWQSPFR